MKTLEDVEEKRISVENSIKNLKDSIEDNNKRIEIIESQLTPIIGNELMKEGKEMIKDFLKLNKNAEKLIEEGEGILVSLSLRKASIQWDASLETLEIAGLTLKQTCLACPEQYDVYEDKEKIGYLRLRHGTFRVDYVADGESEGIGCFSPNGDGSFEDHERDHFLEVAVKLLIQRHK